MHQSDQLLQYLRELPDEDLRSELFTLTGSDQPAGPPYYPHQTEALRRIEAAATATPPVSGIVHFPTGAGKTRVGLELIARALRHDPAHRFVWATHSRTLIRQSMMRMVELDASFPRQTRFTWLRRAEDVEEPASDDPHVVFATRHALTELLERAADRRRHHPWRAHLEAGRPLTLIYDECHQLGADRLQQGLWRFHSAVVEPPGVRPRPWRTIGLSATPVPTRREAHELLQRYVFPQRTGSPSTNTGWPFHVFHRVRNEALVQSGVLCSPNLLLDQRGEFDLPAELLRKIIGEEGLKAPGDGASKERLFEYALQFNKKVLAAPAVLEFLAERIGRNIALLKKTLVFVPNVIAANRLVSLLYDRFPGLRGNLAAVHSRMGDLHVPGQPAEASPHQVLDRFRAVSSRDECVLVNVEMLTEGFDDPQIQSVVLARLTLSTNRFWQMIGRGTRGPRAGGTQDCNVIDPVKLMRLYDYFEGYQPSFARRDDVELEEREEEGPGLDGLTPQIPPLARPPDPAAGGYAVHPELQRVNARVAEALRAFLAGTPLPEPLALDAARSARIELADGAMTFGPSDGAFDPVTAAALLLGEISGVERRSGKDLSWFRRQLPPALDETLLRQRLRMLRAIESMQLWGEPDFARAQMSGPFLAELQREAGVPVAEPDAPATLREESAEDAVIEALLAMAAADGLVHDAEIAVAADTLRRMFGRARSPESEAALRSRAIPSAVPFEGLIHLLSAPQQQLLLLQLAEIAAVDGTVTAEERSLLGEIAARLELPQAFVDAVLGGHLARADVASRADAPRCPACEGETPDGARFCPACGGPLPPGATP